MTWLEQSSRAGYSAWSGSWLILGKAAGGTLAGTRVQEHNEPMALASTHTVRAQRVFEARSTEAFNRIEFAVRLLGLLKPEFRVAVYPRANHLQATRGGVAERWAMLGVPPHATRENIVRAVVELVRGDEPPEAANLPFLIDLLCSFR